MKVFAHRGLFNEYPENSRGAIAAAVRRDYGVEVDIRFTRDKRAALVHDKNLKRLCARDVTVNSLNSDELKNMPLISNPEDSIQYIEDIVDFVRSYESSVAIHFKSDEQSLENCRVLAQLFNKYNLEGSCFVFNVGLNTCRTLRKLSPEMQLGVLVSDVQFEPFVYLQEEVAVELDLFDIVWAAEFRALYDDNFFQYFKRAGKRIIAVSHELHKELGHPKAHSMYRDSWGCFVRNKIDGVCTDFPGELNEYIKSKIGG